MKADEARAALRGLIEQLQAAQRNLDKQTASMSAALTREVKAREGLQEQLQTAEGTSEVLASHLAAANEKITGLEEQYEDLAIRADERSKVIVEKDATLGRLREQYEDLKRLASPTAMTVIAEKVDAEIQVIRLKEQLETLQQSESHELLRYRRALKVIAEGRSVVPAQQIAEGALSNPAMRPDA